MSMLPGDVHVSHVHQRTHILPTAQVCWKQLPHVAVLVTSHTHCCSSAKRPLLPILVVCWQVTTLTTTGYGDITARTNVEMAVAIIMQLVGECSNQA